MTLSIAEQQDLHQALNLLAGKYRSPVLYMLLKHNRLRFSEFEEHLEGATRSVIARQLKVLQTQGLISKKDFDEYPKHTEYELTPVGLQLAKLVDDLVQLNHDL